MEQKMFCYQCEQTVGCTACTGAAGVCGKKAGTAKLQDELTGALIGLARAVDGNEDLVTEKTDALMIESLFMNRPRASGTGQNDSPVCRLCITLRQKRRL